jgi:hypothetical protein
MPILLYFRHVSFSDEVQRQVTCEQCGREYSYWVARSAALDTIPLPALVRQAERTCRERVARQLNQAVDPTPCPHCGRMQSHMIPELRRRFAGGLRTAAAFLIVASAAGAILSLAAWTWFRFRPDPLGNPDTDWIGLAAAGGGGCVIGWLMILLQRMLGMLRYRGASA